MYCKQAVVALFLLAGCKSNEHTTLAAPQRTAVLRFENVSNTSSEDWQGRALSELLKHSFQANRMPRATIPAPGISSERLAAIDAGATRLIYGFYTAQAGTMSVTAIAEDATTQKLSAPLHTSGSVAEVAEAIVKRFGGSGTIPRVTTAALKEYALANDTAGADALAHYGAAMQMDPNFGPAYLGLSRTAIAANDPARAQAVLTQASAHAANFTAQDRADLQLEAATLNHDGRSQVQALQAGLALNPGDSQTLRVLADAELSNRMAREAAKHYGELAALAPEDANLRNLLAYACVAAGDESGARAAAAEYRKLRPMDSNAFDTQGDVELAFGHFAEAEKTYLSSPDLHFQDDSATWKAAHARLYAGDTTGATGLFERHRKALAAAGNPAADYRAAVWQYENGHPADAIAALSEFAGRINQPDLRATALTQAAIWAVVQHEPARAIQFSEQALHPQRSGTFLTAALARFLAEPPAGPAEWQRRADTSFKGPNVAEVKRLALGLALVLSNAAPEALPLWKQIYESTGVNEALPAYLYGWSLLQTEHAAEARPLLRLNPIPSPGIAPTFEALYVPAVFEWRKSSLRQ